MRGKRIAAIAAVVAFIGTVITPVAGAAGADELGPTPQICNVYAPTPVCFYAAVSGTDTFNLGGHILYPGQHVSGTYRWEIGGQGGGEFASFGSVDVVTAGAGLKLLHCHGPRHADNSKARWRTPKAFNITKGSTTCTWKAVAPTGGWVNGPNLSVYAGGGTYPAGDFYAVLSKGGAVEGHVKAQNVQKKIADLTGVPGATLRVSGPRGFSKKTTTSDTGYYHVIVPRTGTYTVTPSPPRRYFKGLRTREATPPVRKVHVREAHTSTADFTYQSTLKLRLRLNRTTVAADGESFVDATVTADDAGAPVPNLTFSLRPFGGGSALQSPYALAVPGTVCTLSGTSVGGRVWPNPNVTTPNTDSVDVTTDSTGEAHFRVYLGTVPGTFPLTVWAKNENGKLITQDVSNVSADADIKVDALADGGNPARTLHDWLNKLGNEDLASILPTDIGSLLPMLADAMSGHTLGGFVLTPVRTATFSALLLSPEHTRIKIDPRTGVIDQTSQGWLVAPGAKIGAGLAAGGYWGFEKTNGDTFPTLAQWLADAAPGYSFAGNKAPITLLNASGLQYAGFGYGPSCL
jgi:hypothetical protein